MKNYPEEPLVPRASSPDLNKVGMDTPIPVNRRRRHVLLGIGGALVLLAGIAVWVLLPHGLQIPASRVRLGVISSGVFRDDISIRASAEPLTSVILDAVESGRVETVLAKDGQLVNEGQILFRLSNSQRRLELLARQADLSQQVSNLSNLRVGFETNSSEHERRILDLAYKYAQAKKQHERNIKLANQGFISQVALEESVDQLENQRKLLESERSVNEREQKVKMAAMTQMEGAIAQVQSGLQLLNATVDALVVRAPIRGRLTDFRLQVGETVKQDQHIGRVDDPVQFKLSAQIDEYYVPRVTVGRTGRVVVREKSYAVELVRIFPQIKDGRFGVEMMFVGAPPSALSPGQRFDVQLTLGEPAQAIIAPAGTFLNSTGGGWVFVVDSSGLGTRRNIKVGRRNSTQIEIISGLREGERIITSDYGGFEKAETIQLQN